MNRVSSFASFELQALQNILAADVAFNLTWHKMSRRVGNKRASVSWFNSINNIWWQVPRSCLNLHVQCFESCTLAAHCGMIFKQKISRWEVLLSTAIIPFFLTNLYSSKYWLSIKQAINYHGLMHLQPLIRYSNDITWIFNQSLSLSSMQWQVAVLLHRSK